MKKTLVAALVALGALGFSAPAHADDWNFTAEAVCLQEVAVVPVLGDHVGDHVDHCSNGNVLDHFGN